jgi:hypothetical protein
MSERRERRSAVERMRDGIAWGSMVEGVKQPGLYTGGGKRTKKFCAAGRSKRKSRIMSRKRIKSRSRSKIRIG